MKSKVLKSILLFISLAVVLSFIVGLIFGYNRNRVRATVNADKTEVYNLENITGFSRTKGQSGLLYSSRAGYAISGTVKDYASYPAGGLQLKDSSGSMNGQVNNDSAIVIDVVAMIALGDTKIGFQPQFDFDGTVSANKAKTSSEIYLYDTNYKVLSQSMATNVNIAKPQMADSYYGFEGKIIIPVSSLGLTLTDGDNPQLKLVNFKMYTNMNYKKLIFREIKIVENFDVLGDIGSQFNGGLLCWNAEDSNSLAGIYGSNQADFCRLDKIQANEIVSYPSLNMTSGAEGSDTLMLRLPRAEDFTLDEVESLNLQLNNKGQAGFRILYGLIGTDGNFYQFTNEVFDGGQLRPIASNNLAKGEHSIKLSVNSENFEGLGVTSFYPILFMTTSSSFAMNNPELKIDILSITMDRNSYDISANSNTKGIISSNIETAYYNQNVTFSLTPNEGYAVKSATINGENANEKQLQEMKSGTFVYKCQQDIKIDVVFASLNPVSCDIQTSSNEYGSVGADKQTGLSDEIVNFTISPNAGYAVKSATINDVVLSESQLNELRTGSYSIELVEDIHLNIIFGKICSVDLIVENVSASLSSNEVIEGYATVLTVSSVDSGFEIINVLINGEDASHSILESVIGGQSAIVINDDSSIEIITSQIETLPDSEKFKFKSGSLAFALDTYNETNSFNQNVYSPFNSINIRTLNTGNSMVGFETASLNKTITNEKYLTIEYYQSVIDVNLPVEIIIKSNNQELKLKDNARYYTIDSTGRKSGVLYADNGAIKTDCRGTNFSGLFIVALDGFSQSVSKIDSIILKSQNSTYIRHNFGEISVLDSNFDLMSSIFSPNETNFSIIGSQQISAQYMKEGMFISNASTGLSTWSYEQMIMKMPYGVIGEDGFVDLAEQNIKGIKLYVENQGNSLAYQIGIIDSKFEKNCYPYATVNESSTKRWLTTSTGISTTLKDDGEYNLSMNATAIPSRFTGWVYVPFSTAALTAQIGAGSEFPTKILPYIFGGFSIKGDGGQAIIKDFELVKDDSLFKPFSINVEAFNGVIECSKKFAPAGTEIDVKITPKAGYRIIDAKIYVGNDDLNGTSITLGENGEYKFVVGDNTNIIAMLEVITYNIEYVLNGGENHEDNVVSFNVNQKKELFAPTREGYIFKGWFDNEACEGFEIKEINRGSVGDIKLYAKWEQVNGAGCGCSGNIDGIEAVAAIIFVVIAVCFMGIQRRKNK